MPSMISNDPEATSASSLEALLVAQNAHFTPEFKEFAALRETERGALRTLEWENVSYTIQARGHADAVTILDGISGSAKTGEIVAVLGPRKSGKTRFLNAISGHVSKDHGTHTLHGTVKLGGEVASVAELKRFSGFVLRHEAVFPTATPREAIAFAAKLMLPVHVTAEKRDGLLEDLIKSLGLVDVQNVPCKKLTAGQRKLTAIGVELASLPSVLFLDEPTADLDMLEAWSIMHTLKGLAAQGRSSCLIVCSMNEASSVVFSQISRIILLRKGRVVYQGAVDDMLPAFEAKKFYLPPGTNLADFALTIVRLAPDDDLPTNAAGSPQVAISNGKASMLKQESFGANAVAKGSLRDDPRPGFFTQFAQLFARYRRNAFRDPRFFVARCVASVIMFGIISCIFIGAGNQYSTSYFLGSHLGAIVFVNFASTFQAMMMAILIGFDSKHVYIRERASQTYGIVPTALIKILTEVPVNFIVAVLINLVIYWSVGFGASIGWYILATFLLNEVCYATGYALSSLSNSLALCLGLVPALMVPQLLFIGTFVRISQLPQWLTWIQHVCTVKYAINIPQIYEFAPSMCHAVNPGVCGPTGQWNVTMMANDVEPGKLGTYIGVLIGIDVALRLIGLVALELKAGRAVHFGEHA